MRFRVLKNSGLQTLASYYTAEIDSEETNKVSQEATYNFKVPELEKKGLAQKEFLLPSHYWFSSTTNLKKYLGALPYNSNTKKQLVNGQYFKELGELFRNPNSSENPQAFYNLLSEIDSGKSTYKAFFIEEDVIKSSENLHKSFPVYNTIKLKTLSYQLKMATALKDAGLLEKFCKGYVARKLTPKEQKPPKNFFIDSYDLGAGGELPADLKPWTIEYLALPDYLPSNPQSVVKNQEQNLDYFTVLTDDVAKEHTKFSLVSAAKLTDTFNKHLKDDQLDVFMFEIRKHKIAPGEEDTFSERVEDRVLLQTYFIPAFSDSIEFVDTQVRQGVHYYYQVIAHAIIGKADSAFAIGLPWDNTIDNFTDPLWREAAKSAIKVLTPMNSSPLSPEFDILPFQRTDRFITLIAKTRYGSELSKPVLIDKGDASKFSPKVKDATKEMFFRTDETEGEIEIFKLDEPPESYESFSPSKLTRIRQQPIGTDGVGNVLMVVDQIEPNRDYFYCARMVDPNGNISNPSNVIKVRIVSADDSLPYFTKKNYDFSEKMKTFEQTFKKYLLIRPSELQSTLIDSKDGPKLGGDLFGKRLVLEIESKKTGRKIDFVVKFNPPERTPPSNKGAKPPGKKPTIDPGKIKIGEIPKPTAPELKDEIFIKDKLPKNPQLVDDLDGSFKDNKVDPFKVQPKK